MQTELQKVHVKINGELAEMIKIVTLHGLDINIIMASIVQNIVEDTLKGNQVYLRKAHQLLNKKERKRKHRSPGYIEKIDTTADQVMALVPTYAMNCIEDLEMSIYRGKSYGKDTVEKMLYLGLVEFLPLYCSMV